MGKKVKYNWVGPTVNSSHLLDCGKTLEYFSKNPVPFSESDENEFHTAKERLERSENILKGLNLKYELLEVYKLLEECYRNLKNEKQEINYKNKRETLAYEIGLPLI